MKKLIGFALVICLLSTLSGCWYTRRTESLDDYLQPKAPMSHEDFILFPLRSALDECTVNLYRCVSISDLLFDDSYILLSCTYTREQYEEEVARLEGIGAEYREDLFRYPAYIAVFYTHTYEYALLDDKNLSIHYVAADTIDFERDDNSKVQTDFPQSLAPIRFEGVDICIYDYGITEGDLQFTDGKSYHYFMHSPQDGFNFKGIEAHTASLEQIMIRLDTENINIPDYGSIYSARAAAYYGATALAQWTPHWNSSDRIGIVYNETAGYWLVHGLFQDRNDPGEAWAVVLDAETGKVLGFSELDGDT